MLRENGEPPLQAALHARQQQAITAGDIAAAEAIRDRVVKQRDESNARTATANANMVCKTALGRLDLSDLLRTESEAAPKTAEDDSRMRRFMHQTPCSVSRRQR